MDAERMNRIMEAKKYQEKAIKALFPERMQEHIDVIQGEFSSMVKECKKTDPEKAKTNRASSNVKKVIID